MVNRSHLAGARVLEQISFEKFRRMKFDFRNFL